MRGDEGSPSLHTLPQGILPGSDLHKGPSATPTVPSQSSWIPIPSPILPSGHRRRPSQLPSTHESPSPSRPRRATRRYKHHRTVYQEKHSIATTLEASIRPPSLFLTPPLTHSRSRRSGKCLLPDIEAESEGTCLPYAASPPSADRAGCY
jgi:hypothetical protein